MSRVRLPHGNKKCVQLYTKTRKGLYKSIQSYYIKLVGNIYSDIVAIRSCTTIDISLYR